ncbi:Biofilm development protein YmgB/AriR [Izhakiella capsodis]|uniref:Biofilm development protein YmgB/AriR n=1 Tax=Izhakiella capsodis TaxID=1367852 RepID=A0A1I4UXV4_9GAMM|nr:regulatory protein YcgZ [Izhakiella capsodis]SFM93600.1 Biofilm development protein YmgB/AriR [Izhakiella capsodis]
MRQNRNNLTTSEAIAHYFSKARLPSQQETLGQIVVEILRDGRNLNRKSICTKLLRRLELAGGPDEESHYHELIGLLFDRQS